MQHLGLLNRGGMKEVTQLKMQFGDMHKIMKWRKSERSMENCHTGALDAGRASCL